MPAETIAYVRRISPELGASDPASSVPAPAPTVESVSEPVRRNLDESILAVLREEAEREAAARRAEAAPIETQTEMPLDAPAAAQVRPAGRRRSAPLRARCRHWPYRRARGRRRRSGGTAVARRGARPRAHPWGVPATRGGDMAPARLPPPPPSRAAHRGTAPTGAIRSCGRAGAEVRSVNSRQDGLRAGWMVDGAWKAGAASQRYKYQCLAT